MIMISGLQRLRGASDLSEGMRREDSAFKSTSRYEERENCMTAMPLAR